MRKKILLALTVIFSLTVQAQTRNEVISTARKANNYFMAKYADPTVATFVKKTRPSSLWTRAVYYEGLTALADIDPDKGKVADYTAYAMRWAEFHKFTPRNGVKTTDADDQCCEQTYIWLSRQKNDKELTEKTLENMDLQMSSGRCDYWTWIDAIQMAMPAYAMAYKASGDRKYLDYAIKSYKWSRNECGGGLFNEKSGLWYRDKDYVAPYKEPDGKDCYWSRGDGWVYAALVRVMTEIGPKDKYYKQLKNDFVKMSTAISKCQREDGLWNPSLVSSNYEGKELTGSALFLYGICWGISNGILDAKQYAPIAGKAWKGIKECMHEDGFLGYVQGTGKDPSAGQPVTFTKIPDFEDYGLGCFLLGATEYYKMLKD